MKSWSKTQAIVALSSAESELCGFLRVYQKLREESALCDFGILVGGVIKSDASAALVFFRGEDSGNFDTSTYLSCTSSR